MLGWSTGDHTLNCMLDPRHKEICYLQVTDLVPSSDYKLSDVDSKLSLGRILAKPLLILLSKIL